MRLAVSVNDSVAAVVGLDGPGTYALAANSKRAKSGAIRLRGSGLREFDDGHSAQIREIEILVLPGDTVRVELLPPDPSFHSDAVHYPVPGRSLLVSVANVVTAAASLHEETDQALRADLVAVVREVIPFLEDTEATRPTRDAALALLGSEIA